MEHTWQWLVALLGAYLAGLAKTGVAGLGILPVAMFASAMPARESVGVLLVVLIVGDVTAVTLYRREASWGHLGRLFPWAAVGVVAGTFSFGQMSDAFVRELIGGILLVLVAVHLLRRKGSVAEAVSAPPPWVVAATGLLAGFTTMVANAAGPLMVIYLLAMRLPKIEFVGTAAWFFLALNLFKVPFSAGLGLINGPSLALSLKLAPLAVLGALSGRWAIRFIPQRAFEAAALVLTVAAALRMLGG